MSSSTNKNPYRILNVNPSSDPSIIEAAFRRLSFLYKPDDTTSSEDDDMLLDIIWAHDILSDPRKKREYDQSLGMKSSDYQVIPAQSDHSNKKNQDKVEPNSITPKAQIKKSKIKNTCNSCGIVAPTKELDFSYNVGLIFFRKVYSINGELCRKCIEEYYWKATFISLIAGWWGLISFFVNFYNLFKNFFTYLGALDLSYPEGGIWKAASGWKFLTTILFIGVIFYFNSNYLTSRFAPVPSTTPPPTEEPSQIVTTSVPVITAVPTRTPSQILTRLPTVSPTPSCYHWSDITLSDVGKTRCVYGIVQATREDTSGKMYIFYLSFGKKSTDFYMVSYGYYYNQTVGNCVRSEGKIDQIGNVPMMVIDKLARCD